MKIHHANHVGPISTRLAWGCSWDEHSLRDHRSLSGTAICETQEDSCPWKLCQQVFFWDEIVARHVLFQANTEALQMDQHKKTGENQVKEYIPLVRHRNPSKSKVLLITANFLDFRWVDFTSSTLLLFKSSLECKYIQMVYHVMGPCLELPFVE